MKPYIYLLIPAFFLLSCEEPEASRKLRVREAALAERESVVMLKEQQLATAEQNLQTAQAAFAKKQQGKKRDSTLQLTDSLPMVDPNLAGSWLVKMNCTETSCPSSAVGDVKNERWEMNIVNNQVNARAYANDKLVRVYSGNYKDNYLEMTAIRDTLQESATTTMLVRIRQTGEKEMEGERLILRAEDCRIIYAIQFKKQ